MGDSGYLVTNNLKIANKIKSLRNHGIKNRNNISDFGYVSRMDNIQAGILNIRIKKLKNTILCRRNNAKLYYKHLKDEKNIELLYEKKQEFNTYHTFVILAKRENELKTYLEKKGVSTAIHYPKLILIKKHLKISLKRLIKVIIKNQLITFQNA